MEARRTNWIDIRRGADGGVAVIPMGSFEAHGPHLPCGTDALLIEAIVARAVEASDQGKVFVFPTVQYSVVEWARPFASVGLQPVTLVTKLVDIATDIHRLGFSKIVFVQGHANLPASQMAVWQLRHNGAHALYVDCCPYVIADENARQLGGKSMTHAGLIETSMMLAVDPDTVDMSKAVDGPDDLWGEGLPFPSLRSRAGIFCVPSVEALPHCVEGRATQASAELGRKLLDAYVSAVAEMFNDLIDKEVPKHFLQPNVMPVPNEH